MDFIMCYRLIKKYPSSIFKSSRVVYIVKTGLRDYDIMESYKVTRRMRTVVMATRTVYGDVKIQRTGKFS